MSLYIVEECPQFVYSLCILFSSLFLYNTPTQMSRKLIILTVYQPLYNKSFAVDSKHIFSLGLAAEAACLHLDKSTENMQNNERPKKKKRVRE